MRNEGDAEDRVIDLVCVRSVMDAYFDSAAEEEEHEIVETVVEEIWKGKA